MRPSFIAAVVQRGTHVVTRNGRATEDMAANRDNMVQWIHTLMKQVDTPPRLIVFPVLSFTGASRRRVPFDGTEVQLEFPSLFLRPLVEVCHQYDCYVATTCVERHPSFPGHRFHTGFILGPDGLVLRQPKVQARSSRGVTVLRAFRDEYAAALGEESVHSVVDTPIGRLAVIVEAEQYVPEVVRALGKRGAEIIVHPNLEIPGDLPFQAVKQARAFENGVFFVSANAAFERLSDDYGTETYHGRGGSVIIGPDGGVLSRCDFQTEGFATATIDLGALDAARTRHGRETVPTYEMYSTTYRTEPEPPRAS